MAVQKSTKSPSRRNMRRAHDKLSGATLATDTATGSRHRRHHIATAGEASYYRGREVIAPPAAANEEE